jgi:tRNA pseudouridine38-40 synthase
LKILPARGFFRSGKFSIFNFQSSIFNFQSVQRYFIELAYKGTVYAGFQVQQNANTIQAEVEKALNTYFRQPFALTGSSRTDAGVHAAQNWFHFDTELIINKEDAEKAVYHLNAILPGDIVIKHIRRVKDTAHCRFDAISRTYQYTIYHLKDPFLAEKAWYFPYPVDIAILNEIAAMLKEHTDFQSFSKKNTQVFTYECAISKSEWTDAGNLLLYTVTGNRFLRGMVRGLVGTMLQAGRGRMSASAFRALIESRDASNTDFSAPAKGLILQAVAFPEEIFND